MHQHFLQVHVRIGRSDISTVSRVTDCLTQKLLNQCNLMNSTQTYKRKPLRGIFRHFVTTWHYRLCSNVNLFILKDIDFACSSYISLFALDYLLQNASVR